MTKPDPIKVAAIYELPVPIWVTRSVLGETYPSGYGELQFDVVMPQDQPPVGGAPSIDGISMSEPADGKLLVWTMAYAAWIPESLRPATALHRIAITTVEAPTRSGRTWDGPQYQLAEQIGFWFDCVRTWVEILTEQDLDPNHRVYDAETIGAGLTFISPPHKGELGFRLDTPPIRPVSAHQWVMILAAVQNGVEPPLEEVLLRDGRAAFTRRFYRRAVIDAAAAVEIVLARNLVGRAEELPEKQCARLEGRPTLGAYIDIAKVSGVKFDVTFEALERLSRSRNDAVHRGQSPDDLATRSLLQIATDFLGAHGPVDGRVSPADVHGRCVVAPDTAGRAS